MTFPQELFMLKLGVMCATVVLGAQGLAAQRSISATAAPDIASGVYAALLSTAGYHGVQAAGMLVKDEWLSIDPIGDSTVPEWLAEFDVVPGELRQTLRLPRVSETATFDRALFPAGTRFISKRLIDAVFSQSGPEGWPEFRRRYKADGWISYSHVTATSDGLDAFVFVEAHCGGLCGEGVYHWLHRVRPGAAWSIMKSITRWIA
jgi:hypothetical protein